MGFIRNFFRPDPNPNPKEVLTEARAIIADEANWTRSRESDGFGRYCAIGAVREVLTRRGLDRYGGMRSRHKEAFSCAARILDSDPQVRREVRRDMERGFYRPDSNLPAVAFYNDNRSHTHADVLAVFDRAIASIEEE